MARFGGAASVLLLAAALVGCATPRPDPGPGPAAPTSATASASTTAFGQVTVRRSGGIAGVDQTVTVTADGAWTFADRRGNRTDRGTLSAASLDQLRRLTASPTLAAEADAGSAPPGCADAFAYLVTVDRLSITRSDCSPDEQPTVMAIITLLSEQTPL